MSQNNSNSINSIPDQLTSDAEALAYIASHEDLMSYFGTSEILLEQSNTITILEKQKEELLPLMQPNT